jgi:hypothetical protein
MLRSAGLAMLLGAGLAAAPAGAQRSREGSNRVAVILDASGSYRARFDEGLGRAVELLDGMAGRKLHRWEPGNDRISVIALDAVPAVIWSGTLGDLRAVRSDSTWRRRIRSRADFAACTDVDAAFALAAHELVSAGTAGATQDPRHVRKYVLAFSDLQHEPPTTSIRRCAPVRTPGGPSATFPWERLRDVSIAVYWMPAEQQYAWHRAVTEQQLGETFHLYSASESHAVPSPAPAPVIVTQTAEERAVVLEGAKRFLARVAVTVTGVILITGIAVVVLMMAVRARRRARRAARRATPVRAPSRAPVPPSSNGRGTPLGRMN